MASETRLTPDVAEELCAQRRAGKSIFFCAKEAGVSTSSVKNWMARAAREPDSVFAVWSNAFAHAHLQHLTDRTRELAEQLRASGYVSEINFAKLDLTEEVLEKV